jgi:hypothetical protein
MRQEKGSSFCHIPTKGCSDTLRIVNLFTAAAPSLAISTFKTTLLVNTRLDFASHADRKARVVASMGSLRLAEEGLEAMMRRVVGIL